MRPDFALVGWVVSASATPRNNQVANNEAYYSRAQKYGEDK